MKHSVPEEGVRLGLVTGSLGFQPVDDVGVQAHGDGLLPGPVEFSDFGSAPIDDRRNIGKINIFVFHCGDGADVALLLRGELFRTHAFHATRRRERR